MKTVFPIRRKTQKMTIIKKINILSAFCQYLKMIIFGKVVLLSFILAKNVHVVQFFFRKK